MSKLTSIDAGMQPINQANGEGRGYLHMGVHLAAIKVKGGFDHESLISQKPMQGRLPRIFPTLS
jgi:hypothetical protein